MAEDPDVQLMLAFQGGQEEAFVQLYRRYRDRMVSYCCRFLRERARAEEAAQDTFLKLYAARRRYRARSRFSTYLYRIATNHCLNLAARKDSSVVDRSLSADQRPLPAASRTDSGLTQARLRARLNAALQGLPATQRAALLLCHYEGLSCAEAAAALDTSEGAVKSLVHRARRQLMHDLQDVTLGASEDSYAV